MAVAKVSRLPFDLSYTREYKPDNHLRVGKSDILSRSTNSKDYFFLYFPVFDSFSAEHVSSIEMPGSSGANGLL